MATPGMVSPSFTASLMAALSKTGGVAFVEPRRIRLSSAMIGFGGVRLTVTVAVGLLAVGVIGDQHRLLDQRLTRCFRAANLLASS